MNAHKPALVLCFSLHQTFEPRVQDSLELECKRQDVNRVRLSPCSPGYEDTCIDRK